MGWFAIAHIFSTILSLVQVGRLSDKDKDLKVIILCVQCKNHDHTHFSR